MNLLKAHDYRDLFVRFRIQILTLPFFSFFYCRHNDFIVFDRFTNKPTDYLKEDILKTINKYDNKKYHKSLKKNVLFELLCERYNKIDHYNDNIDIIKSIQSKYKAKYNRLNEIIRGEGFNDRKKCNRSKASCNVKISCSCYSSM